VSAGVLLLSLCIPAFSQTAGGGASGGGGGASGGTTGGTTGGGTTGGTGGGFPSPGGTNRPGGFPQPGQPGQPGGIDDPFGRGQDPFANRPIYLSGKVVFSEGGSAPIETVIERVCNGQPIPEGYVNSKGEFNVQLGRNSQLFSDASTSSWGSDPFNRGANTQTGPMGPVVNERDLIGCEIRASLPGYRSTIVQLAGRRMLDNPDIGTLVLTRMAKVEGFTISMTTMNAPKDAKKSYEKGMNELKKKKPEKAMPHLEKALEMYPQYAVAWFAKGQALEGMKKLDEAVAAYDKAIEADSKFLSPYLRLATIAASGNQWEKAEQYSATTIRMNPVDFPFAYYLNALSNLQLQNFTKAEESAKEALKMDPGHRMARLDYFLALILANQRKYDEAATHMKAFMKLLPEGTDTAQYQTQLSQIEQMALTERNQSPNP
jgi:tetratricopeptide (TPR) repeat protein